MLRIALLAAAATIAVPAVTLAETAEERSACIGDAFAHCAAEIPSSGRVYACLVKKRSVISPACRSVITASLSSPRGR